MTRTSAPPVAILAIQLSRLLPAHTPPTPIATLASRILRLSKAAEVQHVRECNGELWLGQRDRCQAPEQRTRLDYMVAERGQKLDHSLAKLNEALSPYSLHLTDTGEPSARPLTLARIGDDNAILF